MVRKLGSADVSGPEPILVSWDGRDEEGNPVSAGIYLLRHGSGTKYAYHKLCLVR